jgi:spore germination protein GerM
MLKLIRALIIFILIVFGYIIALPITICRIAYLVSNMLMDDMFLEKKENENESEDEQK